jgi:chemotaxis protein methyltransferase CheR
VDFNPAALQRAARARYSPWALRATPPELEQRWFQRDGRERILSPQIRGAVQFAEANLMDGREPWATGTWDVIFCRNVLMYFAEARALDVLDRFTKALAPGGFLFLGHAETLRGRSSELALCHTHGTFYYQRTAGGALAPGATGVGVGPQERIEIPDSRWVQDIHAASERVHAIVDTALAAAAVPPPSSALAGAALAEIHALLAQERFAEVLARLAELPASSIDRDVVLLRAVVLAQAGKLADAEAASRNLLELDHHSASAHYLLAVCRESAGDLIGAVDHAQRAGDLDPTFAMARMQLGLLARRAGDRRTALVELGHAIQLLETEDAARLALFSGGFSRAALIGLCRAELAGGAR